MGLVASRLLVSADVRSGGKVRYKPWCGSPVVTPEESAQIFARQMARSREMLESGTRVDVRGATELAERGTETFPRRDGRIIEPLHKHQQYPKSCSRFMPAPKPASETET